MSEQPFEGPDGEDERAALPERRRRQRVTRAELETFARLAADLGDEDVMRGAWR